MKRITLALAFLACTAIVPAMAGQAPGAASDPVSHRDLVYSAEQFSNTVSVTDLVDNKLVGVIRQESGHLSMQIVFAIMKSICIQWRSSMTTSKFLLAGWIAIAMLATPVMAHVNSEANRQATEGSKASVAARHVKGYVSVPVSPVGAVAAMPWEGEGDSCDVGDTPHIC